ncbi:MAG: DUF134 domain-containing protein [Ignavibacteriae bacterium]|nr:DUF134 domain-containing protein [Ignavibacteriota bacterium]
MLITNMARPKKNRITNCQPGAFFFKPRGIPLRDLESTILAKDELESIRLADLLSLSHEEAAAKMKISRATFGRIVKSARNKIAQSILKGMAIEITG